MRIIWAIAQNSFREFVRDRVVLIIAFLAVLLILLSLLFGALSFGEKERIIAHFGMTAIYVAGLGLSLFFGAFVLNKEIERQTCLLVLARPVDRFQFLVGKYLGIIELVTLMFLILGFILYALLGFSFPVGHFLTVFGGMWCELAIVSALAICFSTFLRSFIAMFAVLTIYLAGHWISDVIYFVKKYKFEDLIVVSDIVDKCLPNLYQMNWRSIYFLENGVVGGQITWVALHTVGWIMFALSLASAVFRRRDFV